ncbi:MAG: hypothetical protein M1819_007400 [Sarea resinae]|nr:MAG: hypothetical protein M1819_007400 [Sarea resinae]
MDSDEDEDLRRAIQLSLQEQLLSPASKPDKRSGSSSAVIDLTAGADIPETQVLDRNGTAEQMAKSTRESGDASVCQDARNRAVSIHSDYQSSQPESRTSYGISGLDRKRDEEQRLARKRLVSISPPSLGSEERRPSKAQRKDSPQFINLADSSDDEKSREDSNVAKHFRISGGTAIGADNAATADNKRSVPKAHLPPNPGRLSAEDLATFQNDTFQQSSSFNELEYPRGIIKQTWALGYARHDDIKIEEVLHRKDLNIAVFSSFQWDVGWLMRKLDRPRTRLIFVMQAKEEAVVCPLQFQLYAMAHTTRRNNSISQRPEIYQTYAYAFRRWMDNYLRIVVPTANLVPYDWGETGIMENTVYLIDLPRLAESERAKRKLTFFGEELLHFLEAEGLQEDVLQGVLKFDFSQTSHLAFVHTIGGSHTRDDRTRTGYCGLGRAILKLGLDCKAPIQVDFVASSIGAVNEGFLKQIYLAAQGDDGSIEYNYRVNTSAKAKSSSDWIEASRVMRKTEEWVKNNFRVYFPSMETVERSKGGPRNAGTICFQSRWYLADTFPREVMRDCKSRRERMLMHNKMIFTRIPKTLPEHELRPYAGWAYIGSANLSESAWGRLVKDRATKSPKLNCRNWECGVIIPIPEVSERLGQDETPSMDIFNGHVPMPLNFPGKPYGARKPWFYTESEDQH